MTKSVLRIEPRPFLSTNHAFGVCASIMSPPYSKEMAPVRLDSSRPFDNGYELFWRRAPIVLTPVIGLIICCTLVSPVWGVVVGATVVVFLLTVVAAEFLGY